MNLAKRIDRIEAALTVSSRGTPEFEGCVKFLTEKGISKAAAEQFASETRPGYFTARILSMVANYMEESKNETSSPDIES